MSYNLGDSLRMMLSNLSDEDDNASDFLPLVIEDDLDVSDDEPEASSILPILPLKNAVLYPGVVMPINIGREKSIQLIREQYRNGRLIGCATQKDAMIEDPSIDDLYQTGTTARLIKILEMPDGSTSVIIKASKRFRLLSTDKTDPYLHCHVEFIPEAKPVIDPEFTGIIENIKDLAMKIVELSSGMSNEAAFAVKNINAPSFLVNFIASNTEASLDEKIELLELNVLKDRATLLLRFMSRQLQMLEMKNDILNKARKDIDQQQRDYFLQQQMKTIQNELGFNSVERDVEELRERGKAKKWNDEVQAQFAKELEKLQRMHPQASEYSMQLTYVQTLLDIPWNEYSTDNFDLKNAQKILDADHYGIEKVKDRILEHLAVLKLKGDLKSPILCLYGPPGVGKTSLGKSIARALGRKYARISLGGLHDEAEIRGHRKTYIGAMPGRIIQNIKKCGTSNPVFILDEIDKINRNLHGDPESALLEVLDPEQNSTFHDNYLDLDFDLSKVMFIATANSIGNIQPALRDRMEMIEVSGYIVEEKIEIAKQHLLPTQIENHGITAKQIQLDKKALEYVVVNHTRESGVRQLDKKIAKVVRAIARKVASDEEYNIKLSLDDLHQILGAPEYSNDEYQGNEFAGVVTGLAWTAVGGDILFIETSLSAGKGVLTLTGNLGNVMKESATIALEYVKSNAATFGIAPEVFEKWNIHLHVPEGAIPKDGPSAGITMATAMISAFTQRKVKKSIAMTGEITLRGKVLPVGGIKEKILAAKRANIKEVLLCKENKKDVDKIAEQYLKGLTITYIETIEEVVQLALLDQKVKNPKAV